ncbi:DEAD/DEAH box helicase [Paenibacillus hamazuiensis]|uniref:DEAD/DEAH box helicase n=1 Tax=Paenibacillus hamazuiensis TaxID=2936508 RepID=UPI002010009C|nr:DEAD/DEAH box helicase [Paenibacillus hamazuiensis]
MELSDYGKKGDGTVLAFDWTSFHPVLAEWFRRTFGEPTGVQRQVWQDLTPREHLLIAAPTGSGKTLAALLPCLNRVLEEKAISADKRASGVRLLYVTPLKALNNDIHHHILHFAEEMKRVADELVVPWPGLTVGVRTGDTSQSTRASMLKQPPDLLVTTPESLYLMLSSSKAREMLKTVEQIIVDEIHDLAASQRGLHLSLSLERLIEWCGRSPQRIGVSATQKPLSRVAAFLGGREPEDGALPQEDSAAQRPGDAYRPRPVRIIESAMDKTFELLVTMPEQRLLTADKEAVWTPLVERLLQLMEGSRSTIVFVNNRRLCERLTLHLNDHVGYELARSHHGSVAREKRLDVERALKAGELRCLVATSSLELGIDVGHVDLVLQIDAPPSAAAAIQRIGRAGHAVGEASRGAIIARTRGALAECALLARLAVHRDIEDIRVPQDALGVLCQHVVAMVATDDWPVARLAQTLARSDGYRGLTREHLEAVLAVLAGYFPFVRPLLEWDRSAGLLRRNQTTAMAAIMGAGTIPQSSSYPVHHAETRAHLGELDEVYIHESRVGDVFQLGTSSWKIQSIRSDRVYVTEAAGAFSEIPFWQAEAPGRSYELSMKAGRFLAELEARAENEPIEAVTDWLGAEYCMDAAAAGQLIGLIRAQRAAGAVPTDRCIVVEHYRDETHRHHVVVHGWLGRRLNRTWQLVLQAKLESLAGVKVYAAAKDNGIEFVLADWNPEWLPLLLSVRPDEAQRLLQEAVPGSPLFGMAFRRLAETSLLLPRSFTRVPAWKIRLRCEELLREALPHAASFPFIAEAMRICLYEFLDTERLMRLLADLSGGEIRLAVRNSHFPSPFAAQFTADYVNTQMYESDIIGKDLQLHLLSVSRELAGQLFGRVGLARLLEAVTAEDSGERIDVRSERELLRLLKTHGDLPAEEIARIASSPLPVVSDMLEDLQRQQKAALIRIGGDERWISADEADTYARFPGDPEAAAFILTRYMDRQLYFTSQQLSSAYGVEPDQAKRWIAEWRERQLIEPSPFAEPGREELWTSRSAASRMIRLSTRYMRQKSEPVDAEKYCDYLTQLQHVRADCRQTGSDGLKQVISRLQGIFLPLSHWESGVFPSRMTEYRKEWLDLLCASGDVLWIGRKDPGEKEGKIAFFLAESSELLASCIDGELPEQQDELYGLLQKKGASFLTAISREVGRPPSEVMEQLMELVWLGKVSNDQFAPLRLQGSRSAKAPAKFQSGLGRWYALESIAPSGVKPEQAAVRWAHHLLNSYAVVTRDIAMQQHFIAWETLLEVLKQLEMWGLVTRGFWIKGIDSLQFSTAETLERIRQPAGLGEGRWTLLSSTDPANPFGQTVKWPDIPGISFARKPGNYLIMAGGRWVMWIENNGRRFFTMGKELVPLNDASSLKDIVKALLARASVRKLVVDSWNGVPVGQSEAAVPLSELGAERDRSSFVVWPSSLR